MEMLESQKLSFPVFLSLKGLNTIKDFFLFFTEELTFTPCDLLGGSQHQPTFKQQYHENGNSKHYNNLHFLKEYWVSFLNIPRLIEIELVVV